MATRAAEAALAHAGATAADVDAIIVATSTPDEAFPATAVRVQAALGVTRGFAFDVAAACSGFVYGLAIADTFIRGGTARGVLVIGSEVYSRILNWQDRTTCVLFGDGAGAFFSVPAPRTGLASCPRTCMPTGGTAIFCTWMARWGGTTSPAIWLCAARKCFARRSPSSPLWWKRRWPPTA